MALRRLPTIAVIAVPAAFAGGSQATATISVMGLPILQATARAFCSLWF